MNSLVLIDRPKLVRDPRGLVVEPLPPSALGGQRNVHVVLTEPGGVRGNHFHQRGTEVAVVAGPALIRLRERGALREVLVPAGEIWRLTIPPGVSHAFQNTGQGPLLMVCFNTEAHDPEQPDVFRDELIPPPTETAAPSAPTPPVAPPL